MPNQNGMTAAAPFDIAPPNRHKPFEFIKVQILQDAWFEFPNRIAKDAILELIFEKEKKIFEPYRLIHVNDSGFEFIDQLHFKLRHITSHTQAGKSAPKTRVNLCRLHATSGKNNLNEEIKHLIWEILYGAFDWTQIKKIKRNRLPHR